MSSCAHTHPQQHDDDDDDDGITELLNPSSFSSYYMLTDTLSLSPLSLSLSLALILGSVCVLHPRSTIGWIGLT